MTVGRVRVGWTFVVVLLVSFGTTKLLAQLFLADWAVRSAGHSDIAARGPFLLGLFLPWIGALAFAVGTAAVGFMTRGMANPRKAVAFGATAALLGPLLVLFDLDPIVPILVSLPWPSDLSYHVVSAFVSAILVVAGGVAIARFPSASIDARDANAA